MSLHFAYGSNMSHVLMGPRCPSAVAVGPAVLSGYRFFIFADSYASVMPAAGGVVHGLLWRLTRRDRAALDDYESIATGLYQPRTLPVQHGGRRVPALVYVGRSRLAGRPAARYIELIVAAARAANLPPDYVRSLTRWVPHAPGHDRGE